MSKEIVCKTCGKIVAGYLPSKGDLTVLVAYAHTAADWNAPKKPGEPVPTKICNGSMQPGNIIHGN